MRGEGKYDGVFAMWYGKGPGVDRTGDVFRHANLAGTGKNCAALVLACLLYTSFPKSILASRTAGSEVLNTL